jgi:hypothetical protein
MAAATDAAALEASRLLVADEPPGAYADAEALGARYPARHPELTC